MIRLYHFLGGITFAIFLIVSAALFVIAGTLIESKTGSHLYAASFTYANPLFTLLICGFFVNILFSATRRWPFKKRHIPFLITHLGLLMVLSGVMAKNILGTQGHLTLLEGSATNKILLPNTKALYVENKNRSTQFKLNDPLKDFDGLHIEVAAYQPNSTETLQTWIKGDYAFIYGFSPFPLNEKIKAKLHPDYPEFEVLALRLPPEKTVDSIVKEYQKPLFLLIIEDLNKHISLFLFDKEAHVFSESFKSDGLKSLIAYDKGFYGYAVEFKAPIYLDSEEQRLEKIKTALNNTEESLPPPLQLLKIASQKEKLSFGDLLISFLKNEDSILPELNLKLVPSHEYKACCLIASLFPILEKKREEGENIIKFLKKAGWPFTKNLKNRDDHLFEMLAEQIYLLGESLP
ncbi:MAG TPA: hypothetical protein PLC42_05075, partial [Parachlamydiaceae bacterium]|nr:hypothetical protein [Parachlamydiaceae bacterium]